MKLSKLVLQFAFASWLSPAAHAEPILVSDLLDLAHSETVLRIAMPRHTAQNGSLTLDAPVPAGETRPIADLYPFSMADIEAGSPARHIILDARSNVAWLYDEMGGFVGIHSVGHGPEAVSFFDGGTLIAEYPLNLTIDAVVLPLDAEPNIELPETFEFFASFGNGIFENGFLDVPSGAVLGIPGSHTIQAPDGRIFIWRPFSNASQILLWELIDFEHAHNSQIADLDDFIAAVTLESN